MNEHRFIVVCRADRNADGSPGAYELATRRVFPTSEAAQEYAAGVSESRAPIVVSGDFAALILASVGDSARALGRAASMLADLSAQARTLRDAAPHDEPLHCSDCGKHWIARGMTYARAREWAPSNCPACFNAAQASRKGDYQKERGADPWKVLGEERISHWTDKFYYVNET